MTFNSYIGGYLRESPFVKYDGGYVMNMNENEEILSY